MQNEDRGAGAPKAERLVSRRRFLARASVAGLGAFAALVGAAVGGGSVLARGGRKGRGNVGHAPSYRPTGTISVEDEALGAEVPNGGEPSSIKTKKKRFRKNDFDGRHPILFERQGEGNRGKKSKGSG